MTNHPEVLERYRLPWRRDHLKQGRDLAARRQVSRSPFILIGAAVLGVAGLLAWRNRDRIGAAAGPLIEDAKTRGQALMDEAAAKSQGLIEGAAAKGHDLVDSAKIAGETVVEKVAAVGRSAAQKTTPEIH